MRFLRNGLAPVPFIYTERSDVMNDEHSENPLIEFQIDSEIERNSSDSGLNIAEFNSKSKNAVGNLSGFLLECLDIIVSFVQE